MEPLVRLGLLAGLTLAGCRAAEGEACAQHADCRQGLSCHEQTCKTKKQIAEIAMKRREAAWKQRKRAIFDEARSKMADLERRLGEAQSEGERERIRRELEAMRKEGLKNEGQGTTE